MSTVQTTLSFSIRKKAQFYSSKLDKIEETCPKAVSSTELKTQQKTDASQVRKIMELSSGDENIDITNINHIQCKTLKRKYKQHVTHKKYIENDDESSDDSECSPKKIYRYNRSQRTFQKSNKHFLKKDNNLETNNSLEDTRSSLQTLPGRNNELNQLSEFLSTHLIKEESGTLYISGPPGTGKTACLTHILEQPENKENFIEVYINCTTMKTAGSIFNRICQELHIKISTNSEKKYIKAIDKYLSGKHKMILLVLDEIDQLSNKKQSVLYTIFEWPSRPNSKIVLIGIANALDLTDRILPRLQARCDLRPELMHFLPYTKEQIIEIFTDRLKNDMTTDLFSPTAIQLLAAKVAAVSGDIRRALDIGRRVVELASPKMRHSMILPKEITVNKGVELKQVMSVLNDVYGTSQSLQVDVNDNFPLQQKVLLCSLLLILGKGKNKDISVGRLHDIYKKVCGKRNIIAVDSADFFNLCSLVETRGIIRLSGKKDARIQKVVLQWDESEVTSAMSDKKMISDILNDVSCIS